MLALLQIIVTLGGIAMLLMKRPMKIAWLLIVCILFTEVNLEFIPVFKQPQLYTIFMLVISEIRYLRSNLKELAGTVLVPFILFSFVIFVYHYFTSPHYYESFNMFIRMFVQEELGYYFVPAYSFLCIRDKSSIRPIAKYVNFAIFILTIIALANLLTRQAYFIDALVTNRASVEEATYTAGTKFTEAERFRVQALFFNPFDYGYICLLIFLFDLYCFFNKIFNRMYLTAGMACCLFGVITCGSRTVLVSLAFGILVFYGLYFKTSKAATYYILAASVGILAYIFSPTFQEKADHILLAFSSENTTSYGSTVSMRKGQYAAVLYHINNHEWTGRGKDYFNIDLGWARGGLRTVHDTRLWGLEGVYLRHLLEHGVIGYILYWVSYLILIVFFVRKARISNIDRAGGLAILLTFMAFSHLTGELKSPIPSFIILGMIIKLIYVELARHGIKRSASKKKARRRPIMLEPNWDR